MIQAFHLCIKTSKADQFHSRAVVVLAATASDICLVQALLDYLGWRGNRPGPLFLTSSQQPLHTCSYLATYMQCLLCFLCTHLNCTLNDYEYVCIYTYILHHILLCPSHQETFVYHVCLRYVNAMLNLHQ